MKASFTETFIQYLQSMVGDTGKMATLRKGLIENQEQATWPLLNRFVNFDNPHQIKTVQTIAGLFAHHPKDTHTGNFGSLCHQLMDEDEKQKIADGESGPISKHFQYVLAADGFEIFPRVRRMVLRAKKDEIPVDYIQLTNDLLGWQSSFRKEKIKLAWGKSFWKVSTEKNDNESESEAPAND